tara:strand:- start:1666 stop:1842 length:177 start_codon:yes stop_codon:yes gene_type:complete
MYTNIDKDLHVQRTVLGQFVLTKAAIVDLFLPLLSMRCFGTLKNAVEIQIKITNAKFA